MKLIKKLFIWIMVSLVIQFAGLFYVDRFFLGSGVNKIKAKKITKVEESDHKVDINIPEGVEEMKVSFDGKYVSYFEQSTLYIINTKTGNKKQIEFNNRKDVCKYIWLPDRNRIIYAEKMDGEILLNSYDVDKEQKDKISEFSMKSSKSKVEDIQVAPLPNVIYVKVNKGGDIHKVYNINIMKEKTIADLVSNKIGNMRVIPHEDTLIYEEYQSKKIYSTSLERPLNIKGINNPILLNIADDDTIFVGESKDGQITKVCFGNIKDSTNNWKTYNLNKGVEQKNIYVSPLGQVYVNDNLKGIVTELNNGKQTKYTGTLMHMYIDGITSILDGKLEKTKFTK